MTTESRREFEEFKQCMLDKYVSNSKSEGQVLSMIESSTGKFAFEIWQAARERQASMPFNETNLKIQIFYQQGDDPFICGVYGGITQDILAEIEKDTIDNLDLFDRGDGDYLFLAMPRQGQQSFPETGQWDFPPHWELELLKFNPPASEKI